MPDKRPFDQRAYTATYNREKYDKIEFRLPKGSRDVVKRAAESKGMSLSAYLAELLRQDGVKI